MILHMGGGGAQGTQIDALAVTAVANYASLPGSPTLYQMCVISSTAVNDVYMTNTAPESPATGDIQIGTGYACTQPIYLDADGKVAAYPTNAYQYNGTIWVAVDLYTWDGTAWVPPWKYLTKAGVNNASFGGTFSATAGTIAYSTGIVQVYNYSGTAEFRKGTAIDVTPYRYLKINGYISTGSVASIYIRNLIGGANVASAAILNGSQIYTLDVSSYTGLMFVGVYVSYTTANFSDWWLE